jgi:peptidyl-prolyl cis-trans isomerase D
MLRFLRMGNKRTKMIWWVLIIVTVVTFIGGFVFLLGAGLDSTQRARVTGAVGTVDGAAITRTDFQNALTDQKAQYEKQYGTQQPGEQDELMIELQAWRSLVMQHLLGEQAKKAGLVATDPEVVLTMKTNPPAALISAPAFQTDGKFDPSKYQAALSNPNNNWSEIEDMVRRQLPVRKLQERLIGSLKITEPELRAAYRNQHEGVTATVLQVPASTNARIPAPTDADLQRAYDQYKDRFVSGPRTQLEVLSVPKKFGDEEVRSAREMSESIVKRARSGEDFAQLAKDYSEGPGAERGGELPRVVTPQDMGPQMAPKLLALPVGGITDPTQDGSRFTTFKVLERVAGPNNSVLGLRLAQIITKIRPSESSLRDQFDEMTKIRASAAKIGLGKAAAEKGLSTHRSEAYDYNTPPQSLFATPQAGEWGLSAKVGAVSPVYEGPDDFVIVSVAAQHAAGPPPRQEITEPLRNLSELSARVDASKPRADSVARALQGGASLEQVAHQFGLTPIKIQNATRAQPDPRVSATEEMSGALFATPAGKVIGPYRALNGWYFARVDGHVAADSAAFDTLRSQLSNEILSQRQRSFMSGYLEELRSRAKVEDLRGEPTH